MSGSLGAPAQHRIDWRLAAGTRLVLAAAGLLIVFLVPTEPDRFVQLTYTTLVLNTLYAGAVYVLGPRLPRLGDFIYAWGHWIDVGWFTLLITLSSGTNSIFFFGYFFCIVVASFRWGFASGIRVTLASTILFTTLGYAASPDPPEFQHQRFLYRPICLLTLGYMVASRGGLELRLRERLRFLKDVSTVSNPRFGIDRTVSVLMQKLLSLYAAETCALVAREAAGGACTLRRARRDDPEGSVSAETIPEDMASLFLRLPEDLIVRFSGRDRLRVWSQTGPARSEGEVSRGVGGANLGEICEAVGATLDADCFVSVFFGFRNQVSGRLFLTFRGKRSFEESEASFLLQVVDHVFPLIENIRLVDQLASTAAEEERRKIARDLHDSVIQPYVGLQMGLAALRQKLVPKGLPDMERDLEKLMQMASSGIDDLRLQVSALKGEGDPASNLVPAVSRFATRFSEATGIRVQVDAEPGVRVEGRVAAEAFQIVAEGLSNVRRHTQASAARIGLACRDARLLLRIEDEGNGAAESASFTPRSISERAQALGGRVVVSRRGDGGTAVSVEIPL